MIATIRTPFLLLAICCFFVLNSQGQRFAADIRAFKSQDSAQMPPERAILFVGSSSFTKWTDLPDYFPRKRVINRGFGGSTLADVIRYADDIIFPYNPKQIVIYCGENDLAEAKDVPADTVVNRFKRLYSMIREKLPKTSVIFISMKPSPSRRQLFGQMMAANGEIRDFLEYQPNTYYVDVYYSMMDHGIEPNGSLFTSDSLHMNSTGYHLWKKILDPYLVMTK